MTHTRVISTWTELTRDLAIYLLFTFFAIKVFKFLFSCNRTSEISSFSMATHPEALRRERILNSKLYFDVPLSKVSIIYSSSYDISFMGIEKLWVFFPNFRNFLCWSILWNSKVGFFMLRFDNCVGTHLILPSGVEFASSLFQMGFWRRKQLLSLLKLQRLIF